MQRIELIGLPLTVFPSAQACVAHVLARIDGGKNGTFASFINPGSYYLAKHDPSYAAALARLDLVLPDGVGLIWGIRRVLGMQVARVSFDATSLYHPVFQHLETVRCPTFVIGGKPGVAEKAVERMRKGYPDLTLAGVLDGFRSRAESVRLIKESGARFVLCGMGAPHQEALLVALKDAGFSGTAFTCGGFLDQLVEKDNYYPQWVDRLEIRWLYRLLREPRRLCRRYLYEYQTFIIPCVRAAFAGRPGTAANDRSP